MSGCCKDGFSMYFCFQSTVSHGYLLHSHYFVSPLKILFIYCSKKKMTWETKTAASMLSPLLLHSFKVTLCRPRPKSLRSKCKLMKSRDSRYFQTMHLCFRQTPKATLSCISVDEQMIWSPWFVSGNRPLPHSTCSQWRPCVRTGLTDVVINPPDTLRLQLSPRAIFCGSKFMYESSRKGRKSGCGSKSGFSFLSQFPLPLPQIFRGSGPSDPSLGKRNHQMNLIMPGPV